MSICPFCDAKAHDDNGVFQHIRAKHGKGKASAWRRRNMPERERSIGHELAEALLDASMGDPVPEHIEAMFPEHITYAREHGSLNPIFAKLQREAKR